MTESTQSLHESLSAAMDGEAEELELRRVFNAARNDPELSARWQRLHLIQGAMRRHGGAVVAPNDWHGPWLKPDVEVEDAATPPAASQAPPSDANHWLASRWLKAVSGTAIAAAAAFAVVAFFGETKPPAPRPPADALAAAPPAPARVLAQVPSETDLRRANVYMLQHAQHSTLGTRPAVMPFAKVLAARQPNAGDVGEAWSPPAATRPAAAPIRRTASAAR